MIKSEIEIIKKIEAEVNNEKPKVLNSKRSAFLNKKRKGGGHCEEVVLFTTYENPPIGNTLWRYDHVNKVRIPMSGDHSRLGDVVAMWGNKFYTINIDCVDPTLNAIIEYIVDYSSNTFTYVRDITMNFPGYTVWSCGKAVSATMKDANTIIIHEVEYGAAGPFVVLNISGSNAILVQPIYFLSEAPAGDMVYLGDDKVLLSSGLGGTNGLRLIDLPTGNIISSLDTIHYSQYLPVDAMYLYDNKVYIAGYEPNSLIFPIGITEIELTGNGIQMNFLKVIIMIINGEILTVLAQ